MRTFHGSSMNARQTFKFVSKLRRTTTACFCVIASAQTSINAWARFVMCEELEGGKEHADTKADAL
jgi:hypothetical protein